MKMKRVSRSRLSKKKWLLLVALSVALWASGLFPARPGLAKSQNSAGSVPYPAGALQHSAWMTDAFSRPATEILYQQRSEKQVTSGAAARVIGPDDPGLTIVPTFDASITGDPNAAAIEAMINQACAIYHSLFSDPVTVRIYFRYSPNELNGNPFPAGLLARSNFVIYTIPWNNFITPLQADAKTANDTSANATLPGSPLTTSLTPSSADGRAVGLDTPGVMNPDGSVGGGTYDGIVSLNSSAAFQFTRPPVGSNYDALRSTEHEMDEVLGLGSGIGQTNLRPQDLFSWSSAGVRNTTSTGTRYFSIDGGNASIVGFNQDSGGDFGDWLSLGCPQVNPYVQNAFSCPGPGQVSNVTATSPEGINLDVVGYDLGPAGPTPTPAPTGTPAPTPGCTPFAQGFDDITSLVPGGWFIQNNSQPGPGATTWFQGDSTQFPAQSGAGNSYIGVNFASGTGVSTLSDWLLTPSLPLQNGAVLTFYTRTVDTPQYPDRLQVRVSTNGTSTNVGTAATNVGDFGTLLLDINPSYLLSGYPNTWTRYTVTISGLASATTGRLAFRYFVENGGPNGVNSFYVGVDSVQVTGICSGGSSGVLGNISTRMQVQTGNNVLIGGFIVTGSASKNIAVRGIGPSLTAFGITGVLADPILQLRDSNGLVLMQNDNWQDDPASAAQLTALGLALQNVNESGLVATLQPASYTTVLAGTNSGTGVGLVEIYDTNPAANAQLANISTRGFVETGNNVMIGGFIVLGGNTTRVVLRGIGPSLAAFGLSPVLPDPTLELHDSNGTTLMMNDDWQDDPSAQDLINLGLAPSDGHESGMIGMLAPGAYTAVLAGYQGATGIGLVEVYNIH